MAKTKPKQEQPAAAHWLRIEPSREDLQDEILDRIERWSKLDVVLSLHGLHCDDLHRVDTPRCWCADPVEITKPSDRMVRGNRTFRCTIHGKEISIRAALGSLMKTKEKRAELLEKHPALQGIRDGLFQVFFAFEAGENYVKRSIGSHQPTVLGEVSPSAKKPLRGSILEFINLESAEREFDRGLESAPWRTGLEGLLNAAGELQPGWHGGRLTSEEQHRLEVRTQREKHRAFMRDLKLQAQERLTNEINALDER